MASSHSFPAPLSVHPSGGSWLVPSLVVSAGSSGSDARIVRGSTTTRRPDCGSEGQVEHQLPVLAEAATTCSWVFRIPHTGHDDTQFCQPATFEVRPTTARTVPWQGLPKVVTLEVSMPRCSTAAHIGCEFRASLQHLGEFLMVSCRQGLVEASC